MWVWLALGLAFGLIAVLAVRTRMTMPDPAALRAHSDLAEWHRAAGDAARELEALRALLRERPQEPELRLREAAALVRVGALADAERAYRALLHAGGPNPLAQFNLAQVLVAQGHALEARSMLRGFIETYADHAPGLARRAERMLALLDETGA